MIRIEKQADGNYVAIEVFKTEEFGDHTKPPILHIGYFYAQYRTNNHRDGEGIAAGVGGNTQNWAPITLADGKLLIRDQRRMMCLRVAE